MKYFVLWMHATKFIMKDVSTFDFEVLHSAINDLLSANEDQEDDDILGDRDREALIDGRTVVRDQLDRRLIVTPTLKDDPPEVDCPPQKLARLTR